MCLLTYMTDKEKLLWGKTKQFWNGTSSILFPIVRPTVNAILSKGCAVVCNQFSLTNTTGCYHLCVLLPHRSDALYVHVYGWGHMCGLWGHSDLDLLIKEMWSLYPWENLCIQSVGNPRAGIKMFVFTKRTYYEVALNLTFDRQPIKSANLLVQMSLLRVRSKYEAISALGKKRCRIRWWDLKWSIAISNDSHQHINS